jgi:hypothetical protein
MKMRRTGKHGATLPPAFSLLRSELGDFLYAPIDVEDARPLTVLSALTRKGIDPWQEAAKLQQLPTEAARRDFAGTIAALRGEPLSMDEALTIAGRLLAFLPARPSLRARLAVKTWGFRRRLSRPFGH